VSEGESYGQPQGGPETAETPDGAPTSTPEPELKGLPPKLRAYALPRNIRWWQLFRSMLMGYMALLLSFTVHVAGQRPGIFAAIAVVFLSLVMLGNLAIALRVQRALDGLVRAAGARRQLRMPDLLIAASGAGPAASLLSEWIPGAAAAIFAGTLAAAFLLRQSESGVRTGRLGRRIGLALVEMLVQAVWLAAGIAVLMPIQGLMFLYFMSELRDRHHAAYERAQAKRLESPR
jgi:hypothetical protein